MKIERGTRLRWTGHLEPGESDVARVTRVTRATAYARSHERGGEVEVAVSLNEEGELYPSSGWVVDLRPPKYALTRPRG